MARKKRRKEYLFFSNYTVDWFHRLFVPVKTKRVKRIFKRGY